MLTRRTFLTAAGTVAAAQGQTAAPGKRPNLILYMADELRAESLGCYGHPLAKTPNIDRLAGQGVRFDQCHVQNPVCGPSRCSFATGWPVHVHGHRSLYYALHPEEPNLFRYLKAGGYDVYWFGKNDMLSVDSLPSSVTRIEARLPPGGAAVDSNPYRQEDARFYSFLREKSPDRRKTIDYVNLQAACEVLERPAARPFCIFLPLFCPHPPYTAPEEFHDMYKPADLPPLRPAGLPGQPRFHEALRKKARLDQLHDADFRKVQAVYLGMVSYTDWLVGELMGALESSGHRDNTALFVTADHGDYAGDYGLVEKWPNGMNDTLTRVPLVARAPGCRPGHVSAEIVEQYDVMATCLELAGIPPHHTHFARSLAPQLQGQAGDRGRAAFCEGGYNANEPQCFEPLDQFSDAANPYYPKVALQNQRPETITRASMVRTLEHKLVYRPDGQCEFYDLAADPRELHNVYGQPAYAAAQAEAFQRLLARCVRTADVAPEQRDPRNLPGHALF